MDFKFCFLLFYQNDLVKYFGDFFVLFFIEFGKQKELCEQKDGLFNKIKGKQISKCGLEKQDGNLMHGVGTEESGRCCSRCYKRPSI